MEVAHEVLDDHARIPLKPAGTVLVTATAALALLGALWFVSHQLRSSWLLFGAHPEVAGQLEASMEAYRELASLGPPETARNARQQFEQTNRLLQRLRILELSREAMLTRLRYSLLAVVAASIAVLAVLVTVRQRSLRRRMRRLTQGLEQALHGEEAVSIADPADDLLGRIGRVVSQISQKAVQERGRRKALEFLGHWQEGARLVAHEMKTPITSLRLDLAALQKWNQNDHSQAIVLRAKEGLHGIEDFVERYTEMARLPVPAPRATCLGSFVLSFVEQFQAAWPHVDLRFRPGLAPTICLFDPEATRRVVHNLSENAARALQEQGRSPESPGVIDFRLVTQPNGVDLFVQDDGPGIPGEAVEALFTPYATSKPGGVGIGLAASRKMMIDQGGDLTYEASPVGACFRLSFQVSRGAPEHTAPASMSRSSLDSETPA